MTIHALVSGSLWKDPETRTAKSGNSFTFATLKVKDGDDLQWLKILAFGEAPQAELMRLSDGEALAVQGVFKADIYSPVNREPRVNMTIFANVVTPLRPPPKPKKEKEHPGD